MEQTEKQVVFLTEQPQRVRLMYCAACLIHTNHHRTVSGEWVCWCGNVDETEEREHGNE